MLWRTEVADFFGGDLNIPLSFPNERAVKYHCHPKVSSVEQLHNLRGLKHGWDRPLQEEKIRDLISTRFNMWTKSYMDWIGPILLVRSILATPPKDVVKHEIKLPKRRKKKDEAEPSGTPNAPETKIKVTFLASSVTSLDFDKLDEEASGHWLGKMGAPSDPAYRPECEVLQGLLRHALPDEVFADMDAPLVKQPGGSSKKRKADNDGVEEVKKKPAQGRRHKVSRRASVGNDAASKRKRGRPRKAIPDDPPAKTAVPGPPRRQVFELPPSITRLHHIDLLLSSSFPQPNSSQILPETITIDDDSRDEESSIGIRHVQPSAFTSDDENDQLNEAIRCSLQHRQLDKLSSCHQGPTHKPALVRSDIAGLSCVASDKQLRSSEQQPSSMGNSMASLSSIEPSPADLRAARLAHFGHAFGSAASNALPKPPIGSALRPVDLTDICD